MINAKCALFNFVVQFSRYIQNKSCSTCTDIICHNTKVGDIITIAINLAQQGSQFVFGRSFVMTMLSGIEPYVVGKPIQSPFRWCHIYERRCKVDQDHNTTTAKQGLSEKKLPSEFG